MKRVYGGYEYGDLGYPEMLENLIPLLKPGQTALDLGIGTGHTSSPVAFAGLVMTGVDRSAGWLETCKELYSEAGLKDLTLINSDVLQYLRENETKFDVILMSDFLMFIKKTDGKEIMSRAFAALQTGGLMWITTISTGDYFFDRVQGQKPIDEDTYMAYSPCGGAQLVCFYSPGDLKNIFEDLGGKILYQGEGPNGNGGIYNMILIQKC